PPLRPRDVGGGIRRQGGPRGDRRPDPQLPAPRRLPRAGGGAALPGRGSRDARLCRPRRVAQPAGGRAAPHRGSPNACRAQGRRGAAAAGWIAEIDASPVAPNDGARARAAVFDARPETCGTPDDLLGGHLQDRRRSPFSHTSLPGPPMSRSPPLPPPPAPAAPFLAPPLPGAPLDPTPPAAAGRGRGPPLGRGVLPARRARRRRAPWPLDSHPLAG